MNLTFLQYVQRGVRPSDILSILEWSRKRAVLCHVTFLSFLNVMTARKLTGISQIDSENMEFHQTTKNARNKVGMHMCKERFSAKPTQRKTKRFTHVYARLTAPPESAFKRLRKRDHEHHFVEHGYTFMSYFNLVHKPSPMLRQ